MAYRKKNRASLLEPAPLSRMLTPEEAGTLLGVAPQTLAHWRARGSGPAYVLLSARCVRYDESVLRAWLTERVQHSTAENAR